MLYSSYDLPIRMLETADDHVWETYALHFRPCLFRWTMFST